MTEQTAMAELREAERHYATAKAEYDAQPECNRRKRLAAFAVEFWGNKIAMLDALLRSPRGVTTR